MNQVTISLELNFNFAYFKNTELDRAKYTSVREEISVFYSIELNISKLHGVKHEDGCRLILVNHMEFKASLPLRGQCAWLFSWLIS
jgi:hypothetical protein